MGEAQRLIDTLGLLRHPEGGHFQELYRGSAASSMHYLLERGDFAAFQRSPSDVLWHFHQGAPLRLVLLTTAGELEELQLGHELSRGQRALGVVPSGCWMAAEVASGGEWSLLSRTAAPATPSGEIEPARRADLLAQFPKHRSAIEWFTRA